MVSPAEGTDRWFDTEYVPFEDGVIAVSRDVTATVRAEAARAEADARFRMAMDSAPIGMCLVDPTGRFLEVNAALCMILDREPQDHVGTLWQDVVHPDDARLVEQRGADLASGRRSAFSQIVRCPHRDGTIARVDMSAASVLDEAGSVHYFVAQMVDMTAQVEASLAVRTSDERHKQLLDELDVAVIVRDLETGKQTCSSAVQAMLGYSAAQMEVPGFWRSLVMEADRERACAAWDDDTTRDSYTLEYRMRRADGRVIDVEERWRATRLHDGRFTRWLGLAADVTARKRLEETVARTGRLEAVSRVAAVAAHDFGNVLMGIRIFQGFLRESIPAEDPRSADVKAIGDAVERGQELTRQLLSVGRVTTEAKPSQVDPAEVLDEMAPTLRGVATPCLLTLDIPPSGTVRIARRALEQAVLNLVINARDAMADIPGSITISVGTERLTADSGLGVPAGEYVRIRVADTGPGMNAGVRERAMEPFFTTKAHGTGIGLPSVYGTVREAAGAVHIVSEEGVGTTVSLLIPALGAPRGRGRTPTGPARAPRGQAPRGR